MRLAPTLAAVCAASMMAFGLAISTSTVAAATEPGAAPPTPSAMVSAVPSTATPAVNNGDVRAISQVGNTMVIGGTFTSVAGSTRNYLASFNKANGALTGVNFNVNGPVYAIHPGPTATTAYIGGDFTTVGGQNRQDIALVDITTGNATSWNPAKNNYGFVNDIVVRGNRVYLGGTFTRVGGADHQGLAALSASTGAVDPFMNVQLTGHHNDSGSGAQGWLGVVALDVVADGSRMVAVGNFKYADGLLRDQVVQLDLDGASAAVRTAWSTNRLSDYCYNNAFDSWVRDVSYSPNGAFFVTSGTGGGVTGTLCDAAARFETNTVSTDAQPTWVSETGGDTTWANVITDNVVYVGGHQRWGNNPYGVDYAAPGAVPRPGLMALDPASGRPLKWNPGRNPAGIAVYALFANSDGLYVGSNTDWVGNRKYNRPKIAFFPYAGGDQLASTVAGGLPGTVYRGGSTGGTTNVLYRVNAGGQAVGSADAGPEWIGDDGGSSYRNTNSNPAGYDSNRTIDGTVPATTPGTIFDSERWSPNDSPAMQWAFPAQAGTPLQVRLYFANRCSCTDGGGSRVFNVDLDGNRVLGNYDIASSVGTQTGTMRAFNITSDGTVNIDFSHVVENPLVNGIEIVRTDVTPTPPTDGLSSVGLNSAGASVGGVRTDAAGSVPWASTRGAFKVGSTVFYGQTDGYLHQRSFNGTTFGPDTVIDPYHDPAWKDVSNNLGGTYDGNLPSLYGQMGNVTGMAYSDGRLYYTLANDSRLLARWFSTDSGIMDERVQTISSSLSFSDANGMFVDGGQLYFVRKADGSLYRASFTGTAVTGSETKVSGAGIDGIDWRNRSMFLNSGEAANEAPVANISQDCTYLSCSFDGTGSSDVDGTVEGYSWNFGDGSPTSTSGTPTHPYTEAGTYTVSLTVTDDDGAMTTKTASVTVTDPPPNVPPVAQFTVSCTGATCAVNGSGSSDSDGTITDYAWTFGDGGTADTAVVNHTYTTTGSYDITLSVTDNVGATRSTTKTVTATVPASPISFVGSGHSAPGSAKFKAAQVPQGVQAGDTLLLYLSAPSTVNFTGPTGVTGFTQLSTYTNSTVKSTVWRKTATAADAGATVRVDDSTGYRLGTLTVAAYRGVNASVVPQVAGGGDSNTASHTTPTVTAAAGSWVVSFWSEKSSATSSWTAPASVTQRDTSTSDPGNYRFSMLLADSGGPVSAGTQGGVTATTNAVSDKTVLWTVALSPTN